MLSELMLRVMMWFRREEGQDLIEYALVTALIGVGIIVGVILTPLGTAFSGWVSSIAAQISSDEMSVERKGRSPKSGL